MTARLPQLAAFGIALAVLTSCQPTTRTSQAPRAELQVEQLAKTPASYMGQVLRLRGIVASSTSERHMFTVIDEAEYKSCRELGCAAFEVPIAFAGALPETARTVRIAGRLEQAEPGRYLVRADRVETLP